MADITMDAAVKQELESRGINETTGVYGDHKLKLGKSPSVRLDTIKSASIPFAGFTKATQITRGKAGIVKSADKVLKALTSQAHKLNAKTLLGNLKALDIHFNRLNALGQLTENQRADRMWTLTASVEKMSNAELSAVFQTFASSEMDLLQTALIREGRINSSAHDARKAAEMLFDLQALVLKEISNRSVNEQISQTAADLSFEGLNVAEEPVARPKSLSQQFGSTGGTGTGLHANDLTAANLVSLAETAAGSANVRERTAQAADQNLKARKIDNVTVKEIGDAIRNSELTINIHTEYLIGGSTSILTHPNDPMVNIFHLNDQGINAKGDGYLAERDTTEKVLFPELKGHQTNANERPVYGAVNIAGNRIGAIDANKNYGTSAIILKPHVAKRATYIVNDSFVTLRMNNSKERRENFYKLLDGINNPENSANQAYEKIPRDLINALKDPNSREHQEFEKFLDGMTGKDAISNYVDHALPQIITSRFERAAREAMEKDPNLNSFKVMSDISGAFGALCKQVFGDSEATRSTMATYDNVESLVTQMDSVNSVGLARATLEAKSGHSFKAVPNNLQYIEAQIHGPLIPSRDIAEIRIAVHEIPEDQRELKIREALKFGQDNGIKITFVDEEDENKDSHDLTVAQDKNVPFTREHRDQALITQLKNSYIDNIQAKIQEYIAQSPILSEGLPPGALRLDGNALGAFADKFSRQITTELNRAGESTEEYIVSEAFETALKPIITQKAELLREVYKTDLSAAQKEAVATWVVSAKALRTADELRVVLQNAQEQAQMFREILSAQPPLTAEQTLSKITSFSQKMQQEISDMMAESYKGREIGPDDTLTEVNRISFMSLTLLKNAEPPLTKEDSTRLADIFDGHEMRQFYSQIDAIYSKSKLTNHDSPVKAGQLATLNSLIFVNASNLREEAGERYRTPATYTGNFRLIQAPVRNAMQQLSPEIVQYFDRLYPPYAEFPAPAKPGSMPQNAQERRNFMVKTMDRYIEKEKVAEYGTSTHGRGHIARAYIFADVMCNILNEKGIKVDKNAVLCGIAGHDAGRKLGGEDHWEQESAEITVSDMKNTFGNDAMGSDYEEQVKGSIRKKSKTIEAMVLNAADSLDIGRIGTGFFDLDKFAFLKPENEEEAGEDIDALRKELAKEANLLQKLTNPLCANREAIDRLCIQISEASEPQATELSNVKEELTNSIALTFQKDLEIPSDDYMKRYENIIMNNKQMFPVLSKYYSGNKEAA